MIRLDLSTGWGVLQDVHDLGETLGIYRSGWDPQGLMAGFSEWRPLERLGHLQLLLSDHPYHGRELRSFNEHPWWYRLEFVLPEGSLEHATLRFQGADYYARVWLNGELLGEHEGYFAPFEFDVGESLSRRGPNLLVVKVRSPWDHEIVHGLDKSRVWAVVRNLVKGTYEHADTLIQRDVNPVGLWGGVELVLHGGVRIAGSPRVRAEPTRDRSAAGVLVTVPLRSTASEPREVTLRLGVVDEQTGERVAAAEESRTIPAGGGDVDLALSLANPKLWSTWDRGGPALYRAEVELRAGEVTLERAARIFGVRSVELERTAEEMVFLLNGRRLFLRGTSYFPDVYVSAMHRARYERDLAAIRRLGCNAVRVHVHVERPEFYELCDRAGIAVIQDSDLNWVHPATPEFARRAVAVFGDMVRLLSHHPSILAWVCLNEPRAGAKGELLTVSPGPQLVSCARGLDPSRPLIAGSGVVDHPESGDSHTYIGSLEGERTHYLEIHGRTERLNTEFGFDAPPRAVDVEKAPEIRRRLAGLLDGIGDLQEYQYRLLKYYVEWYRITKYRPCSGYFQFMFIDLCPQSFYGIYDWWGTPKRGADAFLESGQPVGVFMEHTREPIALWVVNDGLVELGPCSVEWRVEEDGALTAQGEARVTVPADCAVQVSRLEFRVDPDRHYLVRLTLCAQDRAVLARNVYRDPFRHPPHPPGHPARVSHELGVRLYHA